METKMNPYDNLDVSEWRNVTQTLIQKHPLYSVLVDFCLKSWTSILNGKINSYLNLKIGEMSLSPQATGALLHDVLPEYIERNVEGFRKGKGDEKDVVCEGNDFYSLEIKTSSQKSIYGNRSYTKSSSGKSKSGYYLAINFEKITKTDPQILTIRFGWLDHTDWIGQRSETGQQAFLTKEAKEHKLVVLYNSK